MRCPFLPKYERHEKEPSFLTLQYLLLQRSQPKTPQKQSQPKTPAKQLSLYMIQVTITLPSSENIKITKKNTTSIYDLKAMVLKMLGIATYLQDMFVQNIDRDLEDDLTIGDISCKSNALEIYLIVRIGRFVFAGSSAGITGLRFCIVKQMKDYKSSLCVTDLVATENGCAVYGEFKAMGDCTYGQVHAYIGAVVQEDGMDFNKHYPRRDINGAYFMSLWDGSLWGSGKDSCNTAKQGNNCVKVFDRMGVLVKAGSEDSYGFVRFYKNGLPFGGIFIGRRGTSIKWPVVIAFQMSGSKGMSVELLPNAVPPEE